MKKTVISVALTLLLGPGVGHLYLRKFRKAAILIGATLLAAAHLAWRVSKIMPNVSDMSSDAVLQFFQNFTKSNSGIMIYYDIIFAAVWAYAIVDCLVISRGQAAPPEKTDE